VVYRTVRVPLSESELTRFASEAERDRRKVEMEIVVLALEALDERERGYARGERTKQTAAA